jgi:hypothetical protein
VDLSHFDHAVIALDAEKSYNARSRVREGGDAGTGSAAFVAASLHWDTFIPQFQKRLKEYSAGKTELVAILPEEAGVSVPKPDVRYFKLILRTARGVKEKVTTLTRDGFTVLSAPEKKRAVTEPRIDHRSVARALRSKGEPNVKEDTLEFSGASVEDAKKFWASFLDSKSERISTVDDAVVASHYDSAILSLNQGKSYKNEAAKLAFLRGLSDGDRFISKFRGRVNELSLGNVDLIPISAKEAGVDVVGQGRFFRLVRQTYRGPEESIVWMTADGFNVLARAK